MEQLIWRVRSILTAPRAEWPVIAREPDRRLPLLTHYVAILAPIPALAGFIGSSLIGGYTPIGLGLLAALLGYGFTFVAVLLTAWLINALAPTFEGQKQFTHALKLAVYSYTPVWLAGIFLLVPGLSFLAMLGLYGVYLLWAGLPLMMQVTSYKALFYAGAVGAFALIVSILFGVAHSTLIGVP
jgi:hypothetical protein